MTALPSKGSRSKLVDAYLDRLGVDPDKLPVADRERFLALAQTEAAKLEMSFASMKAAGELKDLSARYKAGRQTATERGERFMSWSQYELEAKRNTIMAVADEQIRQARHGIPVTV